MTNTTDSVARSLNPLKVAIVTPTIGRVGGGIFPIVCSLARGLSTRADVSVTVYALNDDPHEVDRRAWQGIDVRTYSAKYRGISCSLLRDLLASDSDVIHQHGLWLFTSAAVSMVRRKRGVPVVISTQGMLEPWALANSALKKQIAALLFERTNLSNASAIHCSAAEIAGVRAYGINVPVAVIPNGIDLPSLSPPGPPHYISGQDRTLLFLGRLHPKKGIFELLEAFSILQQKAPKVAAAWRLVIVGWDDGGHAEGLKLRAESLNLGDRVVFPGPLFGEDKRAALLNADAFVLPSHSEGFPMAVLEAWAHSLPVLMTRYCNIPEGFEVGAAVEISNDPVTLAEDLANVLASANLREIGRRGRDYVAERYAWSPIVQEIASVYRWVARGGSHPSCIVSE